MKRRIELEDVLKIRTVLDPQMSPDGTCAVFAVKSCNVSENAYEQHLWAVDLESRKPRPMTFGRTKDSGARWSPDGRWIAFVRTRDEQSQICLLPMSGGEARPLTDPEWAGLGSLSWAPDSSKLCYTRRRAPRFETKDPKVPVTRHITRLAYREEGVGFFDGERTHLWSVDLDGHATQLTNGEFNEAEPQYSPDGRWIAFISNRQPDWEYRPLEIDLWIMPAGGGAPRALKKPKGPAAHPRWSPDSKSIAYLGHAHPEDVWGARNMHVWVADLTGGARDLVPKLDRPCEDVTLTDTKPAHGDPQQPIWDGDSIDFLVSDRGSTNVHRVSRRGGIVESVTRGKHEVVNFSIARGRGVMIVSAVDSPSELHLLSGERLTRFNQGLEVALPEELEIRSFDGTKIQGWLLKPPGFTPSKKWPLVLEVHGGPRAQYGNAFFHEFQLLAASGTVVLYTNPRGSQGYGEAHTRAIIGDWGNLDYRDLMAAVDHVVNMGFVDPRRMGVLGGSYGGYMTNWIVGHTDRFRAAVTMRCVSNLVSFAGTSDMGELGEVEFGATPWTDMQKLWRQSPVAYVANVKTPLLILHSEGDLRCPIEQAEQMYLFLKAQKKEVEFVRFPEENHDLSRAGRPDRRLERLRHIVRWFEKYLHSAKRVKVSASSAK